MRVASAVDGVCERSQRYDVIVVGGGLSGCAMATALADGRRKILVLEARAGTQSALQRRAHPPARRRRARRARLPRRRCTRPAAPTCAASPVVQSAGRSRRRSCPTTRSPARGRSASPSTTTTSSTPCAPRCSSAPGIELRLGERVVDLVRDQERVIGVDDRQRPGARAAGAGLRRAPLEDPRAHRDARARDACLSFTAAALLEDCPLPQPGFGHIFLGAWGPILVYPIGERDARTCIDLPPDMDKGKEAVDRAASATDYAPHLPEGVRATLVKALDGGDIEIAANYAIYTDECVVPGAALVGDAAGCSHPLTATGMTIALNDTRLLGRRAGRRRSARSRARSTRALGALSDGALPLRARARDPRRRAVRGLPRHRRRHARASARASSATGTARCAAARARWRSCRATRAACRRSCAST